MRISKSIGQHQIEISGDTLFIKYVGNFTEEDAVTLLEALEAGFGETPFYAVADYTQMGTLMAAARKRMSRFDGQTAGAVIYGADLLTRTVTMLLHSATRLVIKRIIPVEFVKSHEQALAWVEEQRKKAKTS